MCVIHFLFNLIDDRSVPVSYFCTFLKETIACCSAIWADVGITQLLLFSRHAVSFAPSNLQVV